MKNKREEIKLLLSIVDNRKWYLKNCCTKLISYFTSFITAWTLLEAFNINFTTLLEKILPGSTIVILVLTLLHCVMIASLQGVMELMEYSHIRVEPERAGCSVEIRVADSYLTNAFKNYKGAAMLIGINKAFWFQEAEPKSLIADMWKHLPADGKIELQKKIDAELEALWKNADGKEDAAKKAKYIDQRREKVCVKGAKDLRDNYRG